MHGQQARLMGGRTVSTRSSAALPDAPSAEKADDRVACVVCKEEIQRNARKCVKCNCYQGWIRRSADFSNVTLALLVALVSVLSIAGPVIVSLFRRPSDHLAFAVLDLQPNDSSILLMVSNTGARAGAVRNPRLALPFELVAQSSTPMVSLDLDQSGLVQPGTTVELRLVGPGEWVPAVPRRHEAPEDYKLHLDVVHFDGTTSSHVLPMQAVFNK